MRSVVISSGHGKLVRGAAGVLDEVNEARRVVDAVAVLLKFANVPVKTFHDDTSTTQSTNLSTIVSYHNKQSRDLDVSVHFNAYQTTSKPMGVEVLYVTQQKLASDLSAALAAAMGLPNRGGKKRNDLYFLNSTSKPSILIETCFVDSSMDAAAYRNAFDAVCKVIAEFVGDVKIGAPQPEPQPPVPQLEPPSAEAVVDMIIVVDGNANFNINGQDFPLVEAAMSDVPPVTVTMTIGITGNAVVTINGQDFQITPPPLPVEPELPPPIEEGWQTDIETTVFGGAADPNNSCYPPYGYIDDNVLACAVPFKWPSRRLRPQVEVRNRDNGKVSPPLDVVDVGPWMTDDDYWFKEVRPMAEMCFQQRKPLPTGPNKGKVPTNSAGLDLTPAAAKSIGLSGKGKCDWRFIEEPTVA